MTIKLLIDWSGAAIGESNVRLHTKGSVLRVLRYPGIRLLRRHQALWIDGDPEDGGFIPVEPFRMQRPQHDTMVRSAVNK